MRKAILSIGLSLSLLLMTSCATILTGTKQKITFKANADGTVYQNLTEIGKTNVQLKVKKKDLYKLYTIKADGYKDKQLELNVKGNPIFYVNILFGLFITGYFDLATGAILKTDKEVNVTLEKK
ncbi:hypothetical protein [Flavobacterium filum]|uniref:hypothetical protein n=1 Tax=Flavobacterium filum TaxID=370974 RepID=UPI0023F00216|nr:hypothetical protein [Flavobacterium filum]